MNLILRNIPKYVFRTFHLCNFDLYQMWIKRNVDSVLDADLLKASQLLGVDTYTLAF